jgi:hypothetical protein
MTVRQLLTNLDSRELSEWMAFFEIENENVKNDKPNETPQTLEAKIKGTFTAFGRGL